MAQIIDVIGGNGKPGIRTHYISPLPKNDWCSLASECGVIWLSRAGVHSRETLWVISQRGLGLIKSRQSDPALMERHWTFN